jgi:UDP-glucose 4,6-dehydratase
MKKIVITGGAGFIGSHIVDEFIEIYPDAKVVVLDKMTYAADIRNIRHHIENKNFELIVGDICDIQTCERALAGADLLIHAAAESHVDNSFGNSLEFSRTNVVGTHCLMEACRQLKVPKIVHVSTDEVYGEVLEGTAFEDALLKPTNPYSASKAAAEMIINGYIQSFKLPVVMIRANNMFGVRQFPEKIIPKFMLMLMQNQKLTLHGSGKNKRHFLAVRDFTNALKILVDKGVIGECYNIGTTQEFENIELATQLCELFGLDAQEYITYVEDRPFNDGRYAINWDKITALGWAPKTLLTDQLAEMAQWYLTNFDRYHEENVSIINRPKG